MVRLGLAGCACWPADRDGVVCKSNKTVGENEGHIKVKKGKLKTRN